MTVGTVKISIFGGHQMGLNFAALPCMWLRNFQTILILTKYNQTLKSSKLAGMLVLCSSNYTLKFIWIEWSLQLC